MMYQLLGSQENWSNFSMKARYDLDLLFFFLLYNIIRFSPSDVISKFSNFLNTPKADLTIFLQVDGIQCFPHKSSTMLSPLYKLLRYDIVFVSNMLKNY